MKQWLEGHPKAKLMARKRAAILDAAHRQFMAHGFDGTTMEAIASAAKVSIMTLYRHADDKDDLFRAVIAEACDRAAEAGRIDPVTVLDLPLGEALQAHAMRFQAQMAGKETAALLRAVAVETRRFPDLADRTRQAVIGTQRDAIAAFLAFRQETRSLGAEKRNRLAADFLDRLVGTDMLVFLLGGHAASPGIQEARARAAAAEVLAAVQPYAPGRRLV